MMKTAFTTPSEICFTTPSEIRDTTPSERIFTDNITRAYNVIYFNFNNTKKTMGDLLNPDTLFAAQSDFREKAVAAM